MKGGKKLITAGIDVFPLTTLATNVLTYELSEVCINVNVAIAI